jgi:hypothetical protein
MLRRLIIVAGLLLGAGSRLGAQSAPPIFPPPDARMRASFERAWKQYASRDPESAARDMYVVLLNAVARNWRPDRWAGLIDLAEELHDRDPRSPTYGNYRWYRREPRPDDRNALEFSMQSAALVSALYRNRLPPDARSRFDAALALGSEGMLRHKVDVSYTNIFLMRLSNCILIGESANRPELAQRGRAWLEEWLAYTRSRGVHEFSSPTYYGVDLQDLGPLARYSRSPEVRSEAEAALRLFWTDIAANWFEPHQGIAGACSRDYGFLAGHGDLDHQLSRAGWIAPNPRGQTWPILDDLTFWNPPTGLHSLALEAPRRLAQQWGAEPWERSVHYVGRHFSLGTSGEGYGAQDRMLALLLAGGPEMPIVSFSLGYRDDPYGQTKVPTPEDHPKTNHLLPFVASVQNGREALLLESLDPVSTRNPVGGKTPIPYEGVWATLVLPSAAEVWQAERPVPPGESSIPWPEASPLFLRYGDAAAAIRLVFARDDAGTPPPAMLVRDGSALGAQRLTANLANGRPRSRVTAAIWIRAVEGLTDDAAFADFRRNFIRAQGRVRAATDGVRIDLEVPGLTGPLRMAIDLPHEKRLLLEGADPAMAKGFLNIDGRDVGGELLPAPQ